MSRRESMLLPMILKSRDLYRLNVKDNFKACLAASLKTWHQRLGHVNMGYIQVMVKKGSVVGLEVKEGDNKMNELLKDVLLPNKLGLLMH